MFVIFLCTNCTERKAIHITEFSQNNIGDAVLVDVRTPEEYNEGHLDNALNINWFDDDFLDRVSSLGNKNTIYVYCKKGGRSAEAAAAMDSLGLDVVDLLGGYDDYIAED